MSLVYSVKWQVFQGLMTTHGGLIKVQEKVDRYIIYLDSPNETIRCSILKNKDDPAKDPMFVDRWLNKQNVIKIIEVLPSERLNESEIDGESYSTDDEIARMSAAPTLAEAEMEDIKIDLPEGVAREGAKK